MWKFMINNINILKRAMINGAKQEPEVKGEKTVIHFNICSLSKSHLKHTVRKLIGWVQILHFHVPTVSYAYFSNGNFPFYDVLVIYCCITEKPSNFDGLKQQTLSSHRFCGVEMWEQRSCVWAQGSWGCGLEDLLAKWLTHIAIGRRPQFLATWISWQSTLSILLTWLLASFK